MTSKDGSRALFQHATEGILIVNDAGDIIAANPAAERLFGYGPDELLGRKVDVLVPDRLSGNHVQHRNQFNQNPHARSMGIGMDLKAKRKDGTEFPVEISLSPFTDTEGTFIIAFIIDITQRKHQEEYLRRVALQLEASNRELTASNAELENFAYISSHDLQEPLRKIQAFGDRIKSTEADKLSEKAQDYLERMLNAAGRMQNLINDLLAFSRLNSRPQELVRVNLNEVLEDVLSDLEVTIERTKAQVNATSLPTITADRTQMQQLFQNLISNAIKFAKEGEVPRVNIRSEDIPPASPMEKRMVAIHVEDQGIGFDEKYSEKIFAIFQRLEGKNYEGSGIGLSICRKIAQRHGGNITVKSQPGNGATFTVTLAVDTKLKDIQ